MHWIKTGFTDAIEPGSRRVFGVITAVGDCDPGVSAFFTVRCSDGTIVEYEFVYPLNAREALG